jgi:hypothetical protein
MNIEIRVGVISLCVFTHCGETRRSVGVGSMLFADAEFACLAPEGSMHPVVPSKVFFVLAVLFGFDEIEFVVGHPDGRGTVENGLVVFNVSVPALNDDDKVGMNVAKVESLIFPRDMLLTLRDECAIAATGSLFGMSAAAELGRRHSEAVPCVVKRFPV